MSASLLPNGKQQFEDINGKPLVAGTVGMYVPATLVPKNTWQDAKQTILNTDPIILDSRGQAIIYGAGVYRQIVKDSNGNLIWDQLTASTPTQSDNPVHTSSYGLAIGPGSSVINDPIFAALSLLGSDIIVDPPSGVAVPNPATDYYEISTAITVSNGQCYSAQWGSAFIKQITSGQNCINITGTGSQISGLWFYATGLNNTLLADCGILLNSTNRARVFNCLFSGQRTSGVAIYNATNSDIFENFFTDSPVLDSDTSSQAGADVFCGYSSQFNTIRDNYFVSGNGIAVNVQSIGATDHCDDNRVFGNFVFGYKMYGIVAYRANNSATTYRTLIYGNTIRNISGSVLNASTSTYTFGAGVYIQGSEYSNVYGNNIYNTHSFARSFVLTLAPGSIGVANTGQFECTGNTCDLDTISNIYINDAGSEGLATGIGNIQGNNFSNSPNPVNVSNRGNLIISGNGISGATDTAITLANSSAHDSYQITGNKITNNSGANYGINPIKCSNIIVSGNECDGAKTYFIRMDTCTVSWTVINNIGSGLLLRGIEYASSTGLGTVSGNTVIGSGGSTQYGVGAYSPAYYGPNQISSFTAQFGATPTGGYPIALPTISTGTRALVPCTDAPIQLLQTVLTNNLAVTLSTTGAVAGLTKWRIVAPSGLGGHTLTVGGKSLTANQWIDFDFDGSAYQETAAGTLI